MICGLYSKLENEICSENKIMIPIRNMFENRKPGSVLITVKDYNIKSSHLYIFITKIHFNYENGYSPPAE